MVTGPFRHRLLRAFALLGVRLPGPFNPCAGAGLHLPRLSGASLRAYSSRSSPLVSAVLGFMLA